MPRVLLRGGGRLGHVSATFVTDSGGDGDLIIWISCHFSDWEDIALLAFTSLLSVCLCTSCVSVHVCLFPLSLSLSLSHLVLCIISSGAQYELLYLLMLVCDRLTIDIIPYSTVRYNI